MCVCGGGGYAKSIAPIHHSVGKPILAYVFVEPKLIQLKPIATCPSRLTYNQNLIAYVLLVTSLFMNQFFLFKKLFHQE